MRRRLIARLGGPRCDLCFPREVNAKPGETIHLAIDAAHVHLFTPERDGGWSADVADEGGAFAPVRCQAIAGIAQAAFASGTVNAGGRRSRILRRSSMPIKRRDFLATSAALAALRVWASARPSRRPSRATSRRRGQASGFSDGRPSSRAMKTPGSPTPRSSPKPRASKVRIDKESWEDIRPKAAVAANVGLRPDMVMCWFDDAHQYPTSSST